MDYSEMTFKEEFAWRVRGFQGIKVDRMEIPSSVVSVKIQKTGAITDKDTICSDKATE